MKKNTNIREIIRENRSEEVKKSISDILQSLESEGFLVEFGSIGKKTTYAMIYTEDHEIEYTGYTFIRNLKRYDENTGKLKALEQALARRKSLEERK